MAALISDVVSYLSSLNYIYSRPSTLRLTASVMIDSPLRRNCLSYIGIYYKTNAHHLFLILYEGMPRSLSNRGTASYHGKNSDAKPRRGMPAHVTNKQNIANMSQTPANAVSFGSHRFFRYICFSLSYSYQSSGHLTHQ